MRITILSDNRNISNDFETEHGLSIYLETKELKILLDTGASDLFLRNAARLHVDLAEVDYVFLSHGHRDHGGGLEYFFQVNSKARVILSKLALNQHYYSKRVGFKDLGIYLNEKSYLHRFLFVEDNPALPDNIRVLKVENITYPKPKGNETLFQIIHDGMEPDMFEHEIIFTFQEKDLLVYTGCAHQGLMNILQTVENNITQKISTVLGGFHLLESRNNKTFEQEEEIRELATELKVKYPDTRFITGHCTGDHAITPLKEILEDHFRVFYTGMNLEI